MKKSLIFLASVFFMLSFTVSAQEPSLAVGTNLSGIVDWTTQQPLVDVFKTARAWVSQKEGANWGEGGDLALTPEGWVAELQAGQYAEALIFTADPAYPTGEYILLYEGEGDLSFSMGAVEITSQEAGRMVVQVNASQGMLALRLSATNPENPVRNIRFLLPNSEATYQEQPFNPLFLERLAGYETLRFMDWMETNHSKQVTWADRPQLTHASYSERGAPIELMVQLANTLGANAWFNMPHAAEDDYVREFATYVRDNLNPALKIYLEYSNETWNGQFEQARYVIDQGAALNLGEGDTFLGGLRYHSQRAVEIFAIWEDVFGGTERLVRVLASQAGNAWTGEQILTWQNAADHADALAIAPYFSCDDAGNPETADQIAALTVDELLDRQLANVQTDGCAAEMIRANQAVAEQFSVELVAYEGGQHLAGYGGAENNDALTELFIAANRHPRMAEVYTAYLNLWQTEAGGLFLHFTDVTQPSKWGSWGSLEYLGQDPAEAPKFQALQAFLQE